MSAMTTSIGSFLKISRAGLGTYREPCIRLILEPFDRLSMRVQRYLLVVNEE
jgi:hypothetical protein